MKLAVQESSACLSAKVIPAHFVQMVDANPPKPAPAPTLPAHAETPRITLINEGDRVRTIEIRCGCGEVIRLDCEY